MIRAAVARPDCDSGRRAGRRRRPAQVAMPDAAQMSGRPAAGARAARCHRHRARGPRAHGQQRARPEVTLVTPDGRGTGVTDAQGRAQFTGGAGRVAGHRRGRRRRRDAPLAGVHRAVSGGVRVALVAGVAKAAAAEAAARAEAAAKAPARPGTVVFGADTRVILEFQDDLPTVFYLFNVVNNARTPVDTGRAAGPRPAGRRRRRRRWSPGRRPWRRCEDRRLTLTGPFPPGSTGVPGGLPPAAHRRRFASSRRGRRPSRALLVAAEKIGGLTLSSPQLTATREGESNGQIFVMGTGRPARPRASRSRWSSRACRRRRPGRAMSRSAWPALLALWAAWARLARGSPTRTRARDALVGRARAAARRHRRHRRRAAGARRSRPAGRPSASGWWPPPSRSTPSSTGCPAAGSRRVTADFDRVAAIARRAPLRPPAGAGRHLVHGRGRRHRRAARPERRRQVHAPRHPRHAAGALDGTRRLRRATAAPGTAPRCARASACSATTCSSIRS